MARHLYTWDGGASPHYADYYERALHNGILGNQRLDGDGRTSYTYMLPLGAGGGASTPVRKAWGASDWGFPCCWGTLSESFAKLSDSIFFDGGATSLYVAQFADATATWRGVTVEMAAPAYVAHPTHTARITLRVLAGRWCKTRTCRQGTKPGDAV